MVSEHSEFATNDTLRYLQGLFNVKKYIHENKLGKQVDEIPNSKSFELLQKKVDSVLGRSNYNKVDLKTIFGFMAK